MMTSPTTLRRKKTRLTGDDVAFIPGLRPFYSHIRWIFHALFSFFFHVGAYLHASGYQKQLFFDEKKIDAALRYFPFFCPFVHFDVGGEKMKQKIRLQMLRKKGRRSRESNPRDN